MIAAIIALVSSLEAPAPFPRHEDSRVSGASCGVIALLLCAAMSISGCALLASANASHSGISRCVDDRTFTLIDIGITIGAAVLIATDEDADDKSKWLFAIPGVFLASAIIGVVSTHRCREKKEHDKTGTGYQRSGPVLYRSGSPTPVPQPVSEEPKTAKPLPIPDQRVDSLRLPESYVPTETVPKTAPPASLMEGVSCGLDNKFECPKGQVCSVSDEGDEGSCVPRKEEGVPAP